jgi:hypothetical protein
MKKEKTKVVTISLYLNKNYPIQNEEQFVLFVRLKTNNIILFHIYKIIEYCMFAFLKKALIFQ